MLADKKSTLSNTHVNTMDVQGADTVLDLSFNETSSIEPDVKCIPYALCLTICECVYCSDREKLAARMTASLTREGEPDERRGHSGQTLLKKPKITDTAKHTSIIASVYPYSIRGCANSQVIRFALASMLEVG